MLYYMPQGPGLPVGEHITEQPVPALPALAIVLPDGWLPLYHVSLWGLGTEWCPLSTVLWASTWHTSPIKSCSRSSCMHVVVCTCIWMKEGMTEQMQFLDWGNSTNQVDLYYPLKSVLQFSHTCGHPDRDIFPAATAASCDHMTILFPIKCQWI